MQNSHWTLAIARSPALCIFGLIVTFWHAQAQSVEYQEHVTFSHYSPSATTKELFERMETPLWIQRTADGLTAQKLKLPEYSVNLPSEQFVLYVPQTASPDGYGLVVFIPPWPDAKLPAEWRGALDRAGIIFVSAAKSGNDQEPILRRVALALHAYENVRMAYSINPERVYVAGFSGGARVALHVAIGYPDIFRGALIDGGGDPLGSEIVPYPAMKLLRRAQEHLRIIYTYGAQDELNASQARRSAASARDACISDVNVLEMRGHGHEHADAATWNRALSRLDAPANSEPSDRLSACRARFESNLASAVAQARDVVVHANMPEGRRAVEELNSRYAQLAETDVLALWKQLSAH